MRDLLKNEHLEDILLVLSDGVLVVDTQGIIVAVNPALEALTGFSKLELEGESCSVLGCAACTKERNGIQGVWCRAFTSPGQQDGVCTLVRKDGKRLTVRKNVVPLRINGRVVAVAEAITDITGLVERDERIRRLSALLASENGFAGMVGTSAAMQRIYKIVERAADSEAPVIVCGQSGTGKELVARAIHELGARRSGPYVQLNCAALNESLLESELFGHVKGAFTGAVRDREGRFQAADGGDIFLDEIGDVPLPTQVKLLRVLESKRIERVGDNASIPVDVRIISATNRNLKEYVRVGRFREDLLFRINAIPIHLPPLTERREDIVLLTDHFVALGREQTGKDIAGLTPEAMQVFVEYEWPGNVRELKSAVEYGFVLADEGRIDVEHLPMHIVDEAHACSCPPVFTQAGLTSDTAFQESVRREVHASEAPVQSAARAGALTMPKEKAELIEALREASGNMSEAARLLGVHRGTIRNRMHKWNIDLRREILS